MLDFLLPARCLLPKARLSASRKRLLSRSLVMTDRTETGLDSEPILSMPIRSLLKQLGTRNKEYTCQTEAQELFREADR